MASQASKAQPESASITSYLHVSSSDTDLPASYSRAISLGRSPPLLISQDPPGDPTGVKTTLDIENQKTIGITPVSPLSLSAHSIVDSDLSLAVITLAGFARSSCEIVDRGPRSDDRRRVVSRESYVRDQATRMSEGSLVMSGVRSCGLRLSDDIGKDGAGNLSPLPIVF